MHEQKTGLKKSQATRGVDGLQARMAERAATHKTWRQMKGMERVMFEVREDGLVGSTRSVASFAAPCVCQEHTFFS